MDQPCVVQTVSPETRDVLARASDRVADGVPTGPHVRPDRAMVASAVGELTEAIHSVLRGEGVPDMTPCGLDRVRLLRALRSEILRAWSSNGDLLSLMSAIEAVQDAVIEPSPETSVRDLLDPHGRTLLREVAHMLRSPLGSIVMLTDAMVGRDLDRDRRDRQLAIIHRAALAVASTAGDLLTLVDEDDLLGPIEAFEVATVMEAVGDIVRPVTESRGCNLEVRTSGEKTGGVGPAGGFARAVLGAVLVGAGGVRDGRVELEARVDDGMCRVSVLTSGDRAAPTGSIEGLFAPFRMEPEGGSYTLSTEGLGFSATRRIVEALGSRLDVESPSSDEIRLSFVVSLADSGSPGSPHAVGGTRGSSK